MPGESIAHIFTILAFTPSACMVELELTHFETIPRGGAIMHQLSLQYKRLACQLLINCVAMNH